MGKGEWGRGKGIESKWDNFEVKVSWNAENKGNEIIFLFQQSRISSSSSAKLLRIQSCHFLFCHLSLKAIIFFGLFIRCCLPFPPCMPSAVHIVSVVGWSPICIFQETCHLARNLLKKPRLGWQKRMQVLIIFSAFLGLQLGHSWGTKFLVWM